MNTYKPTGGDEPSPASSGSLRVARCAGAVRLRDLRPGLFVDESGFVGFKTEYHRDDPVLMEVFCVDTGEVYWGGMNTTKTRAALWVYPASIGE
jgi:hypothetical protein